MSQIYSVSEFNHQVRDLLADHVVTVQGEVSNFKVTRNQLVFFELKDEKSYVTCFLMAFNLDQQLEDGMEIQVTGNPSIFLKSASFHIAVRQIELVGKGDLQKKFEELKKQLESEGVFAESRKRAIPAFPEHIALITSEDGAAVTDVLRVLKNRWPIARVSLLPVGVQGAEAIPGILRAFDWVNTHADEIDTVILTRGGGSLEDLQAFNSEEISRAAFSCETPVIAGVGHERDETLVEFAADRRAATPSNAAELATPSAKDVLGYFDEQERRLHAAIRHTLTDQREKFRDLVDQLERAVRTPLRAVDDSARAFQLAAQQFQHNIRAKHEHVQSLTKLLHSLSPTGILGRGYSIARDSQGKAIRNADKVKSGDKITTTVAKGTFISTAD